MTYYTVSSVLIRSKMPSLPINTKSKVSSIAIEKISGSAMMHLGLPPYFSILAIQSPKVLET